MQCYYLVDHERNEESNNMVSFVYALTLAHLQVIYEDIIFPRCSCWKTKFSKGRYCSIIERSLALLRGADGDEYKVTSDHYFLNNLLLVARYF